MSLKEKTRKELEERLERVERIIAKRGVGSGYLSHAEKIQRDLNIALMGGVTVIIAGITAWAFFRSRG